jgi:hypothetical protein
VLQRPRQSTLRLIISANAINAAEHLPVVLGLHILDSDPGGLLAVYLKAYGWASALTVEAVLRGRLVEHVHTAEPEVLELIDAALRAAQEL